MGKELRIYNEQCKRGQEAFDWIMAHERKQNPGVIRSTQNSLKF